MADVDPFAQYVAPGPKAQPAAPAGADPFAQYVAPEPPPEPSLVDKAKAAARAVGQSFADFGTGIYNTAKSASEAVGNAVAHPIDTARSIADHPAAAARELARGINDNIPFGNRLVAALPGGAPVSSPEDAALFPRARAVGQFAGVPVADMAGQVAGKALGAVGEKANQIATGRADREVYNDLGRSTGTNGKARLEAVGPEKIAAVDREFGISASKNPPAAIRAARAQVGAARDEAFQAISQAGGDVDMGTVAKRLDDLQADFGSRATTRPFAADVARLRSELLQRYGGAGKMSAKALADEISGVSDGAFTNYQNPKTAQVVQRRMAGALREVQAQNFDAVAAQGSEQAAAVQAAREANQKFEALKTMEPIVKAKTARKAFEPSFTDRMLDAPVKTLAHTAKDAATGSVNVAVGAVGKGATAAGEALAMPPAAPVRPGAVGPAQVARLIQLARTGASRQQLAAQAQQDGTPPEIAANIAMQFGR